MSLATIRRATTKKLSGLELPGCFVQATVSAAVNAADRKTVSARASRRRLYDKATRLTSVEVLP